MKHSLSELQDYLDSGQLDEGNPDPTALAELLSAAPDLVKLARHCMTEMSGLPYNTIQLLRRFEN